MNGIHTIFDTRRTHRDDSLAGMAKRAKETITGRASAKPDSHGSGHASSFLADRGQFGSSLGRLKQNP